MLDARRPTVAPPLQLAAHAQHPVHTDPGVRLVGRFTLPVSHRGELSLPESPPPFRPSTIEHPNVIMAPPPRIGDTTGIHAEIPHHDTAALDGMPAATWALRRNYRPVAAIEPGETEV